MPKTLNFDLELSKETQDLYNEDAFVRFSISKSYGTKHCISDLEKRNIRAVCNSFGKYESYRWRDFKTLNSIGYTVDKNNREIESCFPEYSRFAHFRIKGGDSELFRIFGTESDGMFYVLWLDEQGKEQH